VRQYYILLPPKSDEILEELSKTEYKSNMELVFTNRVFKLVSKLELKEKLKKRFKRKTEEQHKILLYNLHNRNYFISFDEEFHTYSVDGVSDMIQDYIISVTEFIYSLFPNFEALVAIKKMKNSRN
jgi:hypothetical protein